MDYYGVDVFTSRPYHGNPAAVCILDGLRDPDWMQRAAAQLGQPSTAFLHTDRDTGRRSLRWFTPTTELPLCGHATVATAHVFYESEVSQTEALSFPTPSGSIRVWHDGKLIWLELASVTVRAQAPRADVLDALAVAAQTVDWFGGSDHDFVVVLDDPTRVEQLQPHFAPPSGGWSVVEYVCRLRAVFVTYTIRLHRARTEDRPIVEPMLNDLRARRFRYNDRNVSAILEELRAACMGFQAEVERMSDDDFERLVLRKPHEHRTARWLIRQSAHEGVHHLADIRRLGRLPASTNLSYPSQTHLSDQPRQPVAPVHCGPLGRHTTPGHRVPPTRHAVPTRTRASPSTRRV